MRWLFFISILATSSLFAQSTIYIADDFVLHLQEDSNFIFYPKELSLKTTVSGQYFIRKDSLVLTTHKVKTETAIFAIYAVDQLQLDFLYFQKEFVLSLPASFYTSKTYNADKSLQREYRWNNYKRNCFELYSFSDDQYILSVENFENNQLEGSQFYYFDNPYSVLEKELNYEAGVLHGTSYYFEALDEEFLQVKLIKEEKYKQGKLARTKTPATPLIFYTSHF
jgi:hypothetical protein